MKDLKQWIAFFVYLGIWICGFTLVGSLFVRYNVTNEERLRYSIVGLITLCLIYNTNYINY